MKTSLNFRLQALKFCAWGFTELTIDQERLTEGQIMVARAAGIFPDGLLFDIPEADPPPPSKSIAEYFGQTRRVLRFISPCPIIARE